MNVTSDMPLEPLIEEFEDWMRSPDGRYPYSEHTIRSYVGGIRGFVGFLERNHIDSLDEVNEAWVKAYYKTLRAEGASKSTVTSRIAAIDLFYTYCGVIRGALEENPAFRFKKRLQEQNRRVRGGRTPALLPPVLYPHEQDALFTELLSSEHKNAKRDLALIGLLLDTGLRTSEVISLNVGDGELLLRTKSVRVIGKGGKERVVRSLARNESFLRGYIEANEKSANAPLFLSTRGNRLRQNSMHALVNRWLERAGIEKPQRGGHLLRHTAASEMLAEGWNIKQVQENLGHASLMTTERYLHLLPVLREEGAGNGLRE